ncbi:MAG: hypothetical protein ACLRM8_02825 [Alistipes sp.]
MRDVLRMAHDRDIEMAMGFEFGVVPPEYFRSTPQAAVSSGSAQATWSPIRAIRPRSNCTGRRSTTCWKTIPTSTMCGSGSTNIRFWAWSSNRRWATRLRGGVPPGIGHFEEAQSDSERFVGVWSLEYIRRTLDHLRQKGSRAKLIIGGWGGGGQLPGILRGLDRALPEEVVFSCLNPDLGRTRQPGFLADIARHRKVWAVPWLEGDNQMWHQQPRVGKMRDHVQLAREQGFRAWRPFIGARRRPAITSARSPATPARRTTTVETLYKEYFEEISARRPPPHSRP